MTTCPQFDASRRVRPWTRMLLVAFAVLTAPASGVAGALAAQVPVAGEVRQLVTFSFLPGRAAEALALYREEALPLYREDDHMVSLRIFREVESPVALDLMVVRAFRGMAGMDDSNERLRALAGRAGTSMGALYGRIGALSAGHTDQFVEMLPALGRGDPSARRLTALVWYRVPPGRAADFEAALERTLVPWEADRGTPASTGRFLVSDGWDYLRLLGFESLGDYQAYWAAASSAGVVSGVDAVTSARRRAVVASVPDLAVGGAGPPASEAFGGGGATPPLSLPPVLAALTGSWEGAGTLLGRPASFRMRWAPAADGFVRLTFANAFRAEDGSDTPVLSAEAVYRLAGTSATGVWVDDRPQRLTLEAEVHPSRVVVRWTAPSEEGRTEYEVLGADAVRTRDYVGLGDRERLFAEAVYRRVGPSAR